MACHPAQSIFRVVSIYLKKFMKVLHIIFVGFSRLEKYFQVLVSS